MKRPQLAAAVAPPKSTHLARELAAPLVAAVMLLVTLPTFQNPFVDLDDRLYVTDHPVADGLTFEAIRFAFTSVGLVYWHPLAWLSSELDTELFGAAPAGHHFTSILIHAITAGLLVLFLMRLGVSPWTAAAGSLLWAIHPLQGGVVRLDRRAQGRALRPVLYRRPCSRICATPSVRRARAMRPGWS